MTENMDLVASLQALPETEPVEIEGVQFGGARTCNSACVALTVNIAQTICLIVASCA
jgi:hypothetical protein